MNPREFRYCPRCATPLIQCERGGMRRPACPRPECGFTHWNNPIPVVAAIVERDDAVILVRSRGWPEHCYGLVAGFLESGETPEQAILRELREELGIDGRIESFVGAHSFVRMNQILFTYHVTAPDGDIVLCERELADYIAVPAARLKPWPEGTGPALRDWLVARGHAPEVVEFGRARYD